MQLLFVSLEIVRKRLKKLDDFLTMGALETILKTDPPVFKHVDSRFGASPLNARGKQPFLSSKFSVNTIFGLLNRANTILLISLNRNQNFSQRPIGRDKLTLRLKLRIK